MKLYKTVKDIDTKDWDAIIIGSGMGGLTNAATLSKLGYKCLVIEQHYVPGGFTHAFQRKGFEWDVGVHCIGDADPRSSVGRMFQYITEGRLKWEYFGEIYETFRFPENHKYVFYSEKHKFRETVENYFPEEREAIQKYFQYIDTATKQMKMFFAMKALPAPLTTALGKTALGGKKWRERTTESVLNELGLSEKCRALLLAQWGYYGETPHESSFAIQATVVNHFERGAYYPIGGAPSIARETIETIRKAGGDIAVRSPVEELIFENNKVVGVTASHGGQRYEFKSKKVFSAISALTLIKKLLPKKYQELPWSKEILKFHQSPPHLCMYLGFEGDVEKAGATRSSQWIFNTWDMNEKYWDFKDPHSRPAAIFCSFPSIKDPKHDPGPNHRHTGEVVTFVDYKDFDSWHDSRRGFRPEEYAQVKADIERRLFAEFSEGFPELAKLVVYKEMSTPLSTEFFDRAPEGGIYGLEHTPRRMTSTALRARTPISGLFLSGSDLSTGGVAGALTGGFLAAASIEPRLLKEMI